MWQDFSQELDAAECNQQKGGRTYSLERTVAGTRSPQACSFANSREVRRSAGQSHPPSGKAGYEGRSWCGTKWRNWLDTVRGSEDTVKHPSSYER